MYQHQDNQSQTPHKSTEDKFIFNPDDEKFIFNPNESNNDEVQPEIKLNNEAMIEEGFLGIPVELKEMESSSESIESEIENLKCNIHMLWEVYVLYSQEVQKYENFAKGICGKIRDWNKYLPSPSNQESTSTSVDGNDPMLSMELSINNEQIQAQDYFLVHLKTIYEQLLQANEKLILKHTQYVNHFQEWRQGKARRDQQSENYLTCTQFSPSLFNEHTTISNLDTDSRTQATSEDDIFSIEPDSWPILGWQDHEQYMLTEVDVESPGDESTLFNSSSLTP